MLDKFDMPIRISAIDYVGTYNENAAVYRGRALSELKILYSQMQFQSLTQYKRTVNIGDNVVIECHISFGAAFVTIIVGAGGGYVSREKECFCSTFGIAAGRIVTLKDEIPEYESIIQCYPEDGSYRADVHICQQVAQGNPRLVETAEVHESAGKSSRSGTRSQNIDFSINSVILNVPYTDRYKHEPGGEVLVLVAPLVLYEPEEVQVAMYGGTYWQKNGSWSPEINKRRIVSGFYMGAKKETDAPISTSYEKSSGVTGSIMRDRALWKGDTKFCPFRILPISVPSCFSF